MIGAPEAVIGVGNVGNLIGNTKTKTGLNITARLTLNGIKKAGASVIKRCVA